MMIEVMAKDLKPGDVLAGAEVESIQHHRLAKLTTVYLIGSGHASFPYDFLLNVSREEEITVKLTRAQCDLISAVFQHVILGDGADEILDIVGRSSEVLKTHKVYKLALDRVVIGVDRTKA